ncbi:MAG: DUF1192 domain-containing protein [Pseudomonadota bacterium]
MDEEAIRVKPDLALTFIAKQDLSDMSVPDLQERIGALKAEISRCEAAIQDRGETRSAAEQLFKS